MRSMVVLKSGDSLVVEHSGWTGGDWNGRPAIKFHLPNEPVDTSGRDESVGVFVALDSVAIFAPCTEEMILEKE